MHSCLVISLQIYKKKRISPATTRSFALENAKHEQPGALTDILKDSGPLQEGVEADVLDAEVVGAEGLRAIKQDYAAEEVAGIQERDKGAVQVLC